MTLTETGPNAGRPDAPEPRHDDGKQSLAWRVTKLLAALAVPLAAVIAAFAVGAIILLALGANPIQGYAALLEGAFGGWDQLADTALKAMPLLLVGTGICIAFRAGVINIGGEGQIIMGAILATSTALIVPDLPPIVLVPLVLLAGAVGGGCWGAIPGALKAYFGVSEILSTIMLNIVAAQFLSFLLQDLLIEEGAIRIQQTERLSESADLPLLPGGTRLHLGVPIAISSPCWRGSCCSAARSACASAPSATTRTRRATPAWRSSRASSRRWRSAAPAAASPAPSSSSEASRTV